MCLDDGRNLALKTANLLEIDTREFLDGSSITVSLVGAPITPPRLYPPSPLTVSSQVKVVGLAQSVQYNGLRGCIAGHAKPGSSGETRVRVALHVENALPAVKVCTYARASMHLPACVHLNRVMMN